LTPDELIQKFSCLNTWNRAGKRAQNKPLLILFALGKLASSNTRRLAYVDCEPDYANLLREFGRVDTVRPNPHHAFYRLKNDEGGALWSINDPSNLVKETSSGDALVSSLKDHNVDAGFTTELLEAFDRQPDLISRLSEYMLASHFSESLHSEILASVGLPPYRDRGASRRRDPNFRPSVLTAYEYRCAICGFSLKLGTAPVGLEAAHIKWHNAGGPEETNNGLALCSLHHKLFDRGVFAISKDYCLEESNLTNSQGVETVSSFRGKEILLPQNPSFHPRPEYLQWHKREVFRGEIR
jgi:putative restriction endonuclease